MALYLANSKTYGVLIHKENICFSACFIKLIMNSSCHGNKFLTNYFIHLFFFFCMLFMFCIIHFISSLYSMVYCGPFSVCLSVII